MYRMILALLAASCARAGWVEYNFGPFRVVSDAGDKPARERLNEMEQLRHALGVLLGQDSLGVGGPQEKQLKTVWPIDLVLFSSAKEYAAHAPNQPMIAGGSAMLAAWSADKLLPGDFLRELARTLIDDNSGRMPPVVETALCDLFSTIDVKGTKVLLGAPLPAGQLPPERLHEWAKIQLLATHPDYSGKIRVYLNNLQGLGDLSLAARNAYGLTPKQLDQKIDDYLRAGNFEAAPVDGEALNPNTDFIEKPVSKEAISQLMTELAAGGKDFPPDSPRGLAAKNTRPSLELAIKANPRWAEPHVKLAALETDPAAKVKDLKDATTLEPRNPAYWQELAKAQMEAHLYADADKSWAAAMRAAPTQAERARIEKTRLDMDAERAAYEAAEKKRIADEQAAELQRIKDAAAAEVHAAEAAANQKLGGVRPGERPVEWWDDPPGEKLSGTLAQVDCLAGGPMRLTIDIDGGGTIRLLIRDPNRLTVHSAEGVKFACGAARPAKKIRVIYNVRADAKYNTVGDAAMVEFP
jgi:hypothetical protein